MPSMTDAEVRTLARELFLPRLLEEKMLRLITQGRLSKWFSGIGQEAIAVGVTHALEPDDWILPLHRNLGVFTTRSLRSGTRRGLDLDRLLRQLFAKADGYTQGRDRTFHFGSLPDRVVGMISHLGAMLPVADGLALAAQLRGERRVAAVFSGDGGTSEGDFHEAVNLAAVWRLPVLFVIENNGWGLSTPTTEQYACVDLADKAVGYGIAGEVVDGNDVFAVLDAVEKAAARARGGEGPTLLEFKTFRMRGHEEASGTDYVPKDLLDEWARRDPIARFEAACGLPPDELAAITAELKADVDARVAAALDAPEPDSTPEREQAAVFFVDSR
ncbi:MAG: thiamine pyrophosphate-dependent dehydrogenase E1 component subunit alpha, partial [Acidimicrobiales bacterium]